MTDPTPIDTGTDHLLAHRDGRVAVLTLNRPEARNAQSGAMMGAFAALLPQLADDDDVGCVVITGAGRAFCAGGDVKGFAEGAKSAGAPLEERVRGLRRGQRATTGALYELPKPTIAAIPGPAAGAGLSLALACDLRTMADDAFLTTAFRNIGFSGDHAGSWLLTNIVGTARARELYYTADRVRAERALKLGLVNHVFPADALQAETLRSGPAHRRRAAHRPGLHEGEPQPRPPHRRLDRLRHGGRPHVAHRHDRRPQGGRPGLRREAPARVPRSVAVGPADALRREASRPIRLERLVEVVDGRSQRPPRTPPANCSDVGSRR